MAKKYKRITKLLKKVQNLSNEQMKNALKISQISKKLPTVHFRIILKIILKAISRLKTCFMQFLKSCIVKKIEPLIYISIFSA